MTSSPRNPKSWKAAVHKPAFRRKFTLNDEMLTRAPRGYPADHELIEDLGVPELRGNRKHRRRHDRRRTPVEVHCWIACSGVAPLIDYLCSGV